MTEATEDLSVRTPLPGGRLAEALAAAQAEFPVVAKGKSAKAGANYSFAYATIADYAQVIYPILGKHGLAYTCSPQWYGDRGFHMIARLTHSSGEFIEGVLPLHGTKPQEIGGSISYARRYLFVSLTGAFADDEAADASLAKQQAETAKRAQNPNARKSTKAKAASAEAAVGAGEQNMVDPWAEGAMANTSSPLSPAQSSKMHALFAEIGVTDRGERLEKTAAIVGRLVSSSSELRSDEGRVLIDALEKRKADLIADGTIAKPEAGPCGACGQINGAHSRTCPTQGDRS